MKKKEIEILEPEWPGHPLMKQDWQSWWMYLKDVWWWTSPLSRKVYKFGDDKMVVWYLTGKRTIDRDYGNSILLTPLNTKRHKLAMRRLKARIDK